MRHALTLLVVLAVPLSALAQDAGVGLGDAGAVALCRDDLAQDRQPNLTPDGGNLQNLAGIQFVSPRGIRVDTNQAAFNPNKIILPFDQQLDINFVYESAGASHTVGYLFYDQLIARGYVNTRGTADSSDDYLVDSDNNGIADFHEDLFNVQEVRANPRPYIGTARRCSSNASQITLNVGTAPNFNGSGNFTVGTRTYWQPDLAMNSNCDTTVNGTQIGTDAVANAASVTDNGIYPRVPNLLEPAGPANGNMGLGRLIFLHMDDDTDTKIWNSMTPVTDSSNLFDGIPDYDVSAYDALGNAVGTNPDPGITANDRTVSMGVVPGNRELVFFAIVYYSANSPNQTCLVKRPGTFNSCRLSLRSPTNVFFSKTMLNLDMEGADPISGGTLRNVATRDIGCDYNGGTTTCGDTGTALGGWLDAVTYVQLQNLYGLTMPHQAANVVADPSGVLPHVLVGAPTTDPARWVFGFEDLTGGGDRDFNDIVFLIQKRNGGFARSGVLSGDISPSIAEDFTITNVTFTRDDDVSRGLWTELTPGACNTSPPPRITYYLAIDCRICTSGVCVNNPSPTWIPLTFTPSNATTVSVDLLSLGFLGSQLCWRSDLETYNERCQPGIYNIDVGYQAIRAGYFAKSAITPEANAYVYGVYETPGKDMTPVPTTRTYDNRKDFSLRGHFFLDSIYDPEDPNTPNRVNRWEAGQALANRSNAQLAARNLYTRGVDGGTIAITSELTAANTTSPAFPNSSCSITNASGNPDYLYDLNRDGVCNANDRLFLKDWLYGFEDTQGVATGCGNGTCVVQGGATDVKRAWAFGGVTLSTPAFVGPPGYPAWYQRSSLIDQDRYRAYAEALKDRAAVTYVGTSTGFFHAINSGAVASGDDACTTTAVEQRGYFKHQSGCTPPRNYGDGSELWAYLPRVLIDDYRNHYVGYLRSAALDKAVLDASPAVADVDLGGFAQPWTRDTTQPSRRGAMTTIVSATGSRQGSAFALNVSVPTQPLVLWEYLLGSNVPAANTLKVGSAAVPPIDTLGSRHSPPIVRVGSNNAAVDGDWVAIVATDYVPNTNTAPTLYVMDMSTGLPISTGTGTSTRLYAGVVPTNTTEANFGFGGSPAVLDVRGSAVGSGPDGKYDVAYVPTTNGKIYRLNFYDVDDTRAAGRAIGMCEVADVRTMLMNNAALNAPAATAAQAALQGIFSSVAARYDGSKVELYVGTSDNPDTPNDPTATNYYVVSLRDENPTGTCAQKATFAWAQRLDAGQQSWGGVTLSGGSAFLGTAVGKAADACNLAEDKGGKFYAFNQTNGVAQAGSGTNLQTHVVSAPVVHDEHLFLLTVDGKVKVQGGSQFNRDRNLGQQGAPRILLWQAIKNGRMP